MKNTIKELTEGMQRLCAVANRIVAQDGHASRIEVDLLMEDLRSLYDVALRLTGDALPEPQPEPTPVEEEVPEPQPEEKMMAMMSTLAAMAPQPEPEPVPESEELPVDGGNREIQKENGSMDYDEVGRQEPEEQPLMEELEDNGNALLFDEVVVEEEKLPADGGNPVNPEDNFEDLQDFAKREPEPEPVKEQASLLDYLQQPAARTLGESLAAAKPVQSSLEKKVDDLRTVININDKFSFMSELFKGNMKAYNDFIMRLNATEVRDEAMAYVAEVAAQYKWNEESLAVKAFYKVFDKKF